MRPTIASSALLLVLGTTAEACGSLQTATTPVAPVERKTPGIGEVPDGILLEQIRHSELIVLATPRDLQPALGSFSPSVQLGARETWYHVRLVVDSVGKGRLGQAKSPDYGLLPAMYAPPDPFDHLKQNEIVIQYPAVTSIGSDWASAPPPLIGEQAVYIFRRCWNCVTLSIATGVGTYKASPLVAAGWGSKLNAAEWPRVATLLARVKQASAQR
jgi:hypothetical protein